MDSISRRRFTAAAASAALVSLVSPRLLQAQTQLEAPRSSPAFHRAEPPIPSAGA